MKFQKISLLLICLIISCSGNVGVDFKSVYSIIDSGNYGDAEVKIRQLEFIELNEREEQYLQFLKAFLKMRQGYYSIASGYFFDMDNFDTKEGLFMQEKLLQKGFLHYQYNQYHETLIILKKLYNYVINNDQFILTKANESYITSLFQLYLECYLKIDEKENARFYLNECKSLFHGYDNPPGYLFDYYEQLLDDSGPDFIKLSKILQDYQSISPYWRSHITLGTSEIGLADKRYIKTIALLETFTKQAEENKQLLNQARSCFLMGGIYRDKSQWLEALEEFKYSRELYTSINHGTPALLAEYQEGVCYYHLGKYNQAQEIFSLVISRINRDKYPQIFTELLSFSGSSSKILGQYKQAEIYFQQALDSYTQLSNKQGISETLNNLGVIYYLQMDYPRAISSFLQVGQMLPMNEENSQTLAVLWNNLGNIYRKTGLLQKAVETFKLGLEQNVTDLEIEIHLLLNQARCFFELNKKNKATGLLEEAAIKANKNNMQRLIPEIDYFTARLLMEDGFYSKAVEHLLKAQKVFQTSRDSKKQAKTAYSLGIAYLNLKQTGTAIELLEKAAELYDEISLTLVGEQIKTQYRSEYDYVLELLIELLVNNEQNEKAFYYVEKTKARNMLENLSRNSFQVSSLVPENLLKLRKQLLRIYNNLTSDIMDKSYTASDLLLQLEDTEKALFELQREIELVAPDTVDLEGGTVLTPSEIQKFMSSQDVILEYCIIGGNLYLFTLSKDNLDVHVLNKSSDIFKQIFEEKDNPQELELIALDFRQVIMNKGSIRNIKAAGRRLFNNLLEPVYQKLQDHNNWIIVPESTLFYVPFAALVNKNDEYLIQTDTEISYSHSASYYINQLNREQSQWKKEYLFFALPDDHLFNGWYKDIEEIISFYKQPDYYFHNNARESTLQTMDLMSYRTIQFLQHGFTFDSFEHINSSGLIFTKNDLDGYDNYLILDEIFDLKMNPALLILTACSTGLGKAIPGEGLYGMNQAFFFAGARSILSTLWNVYIVETNEYSIILNRLLGVQDFQPKKAVIKAQKLLFEERPHPVYWAPFVLFGYGG